MYAASALNEWFLYSIKNVWNLTDSQAVCVRDRIVERIYNTFDPTHNPNCVNEYVGVMVRDFHQHMPLHEFNKKHSLSLPTSISSVANTRRENAGS